MQLSIMTYFVPAGVISPRTPTPNSSIWEKQKLNFFHP